MLGHQKRRRRRESVRIRAQYYQRCVSAVAARHCTCIQRLVFRSQHYSEGFWAAVFSCLLAGIIATMLLIYAVYAKVNDVRDDEEVRVQARHFLVSLLLLMFRSVLTSDLSSYPSCHCSCGSLLKPSLFQDWKTGSTFRLFTLPL